MSMYGAASANLGVQSNHHKKKGNTKRNHGQVQDKTDPLLEAGQIHNYSQLIATSWQLLLHLTLVIHKIQGERQPQHISTAKHPYPCAHCIIAKFALNTKPGRCPLPLWTDFSFIVVQSPARFSDNCGVYPGNTVCPFLFWKESSLVCLDAFENAM